MKKCSKGKKVKVIVVIKVILLVFWRKKNNIGMDMLIWKILGIGYI